MIYSTLKTFLKKRHDHILHWLVGFIGAVQIKVGLAEIILVILEIKNIETVDSPHGILGEMNDICYLDVPLEVRCLGFIIVQLLRFFLVQFIL